MLGFNNSKFSEVRNDRNLRWNPNHGDDGDVHISEE
jgi:hypothetical protein